MTMRRVAACCVLWLCASTTLKADSLVVGNFSAGDLAGWKPHSFHGATLYRLDHVDGRTGLRADSHASASGMVRELPIDLERTPVLHWWWRVANVLDGIDERTKAGDDYPARVYVVVSGGAAFWRTRTLVYVWSSAQPAGSRWDSAYTSNAKMIALRSGAKAAGRWVEERRDVRADLRAAFGEDITRIDAVAVMTDTDDSGQAATAWYGDIDFEVPR